MSDAPSNLTSGDQEQLVAYLDGELPADQCEAVENRLSADGTYRREMQRLARAWDALDGLPQATASDGFAKTTIEMVTVAAEKEIASETVASGRRRIRYVALAFGLLVVSAIVGFVGARIIWPDPNRQLIADLPVIEQLNAFSQFQDISFLRLLNERAGGKYHVLGADALEDARGDLLAVSAATQNVRRQRVRKLDSDQARDLSVNFARFLELDGAEQRRLRQLHRDLVDANDANVLIDTMNQYTAWLADRSAGERAALRELSADARIERIGQWLDQDRFRAVLQLSQPDRDALREAVTLSLRDIREEILRDIKSPMKDRLKQLDDREFAQRLMRPSGLRFILQRGNDRRRMLAIYQRAHESLSKEAQRYLDSRPSIHTRLELFRHWVMQAFRPPEVTEKQLEEFFASNVMTPDEREALLALPKKQMRESLEQRYYQHRYGPEWDHEGDPPGMRGRPPGKDLPPRRRGGPGGRRNRHDRSDGPPRPSPGSRGPRPRP